MATSDEEAATNMVTSEKATTTTMKSTIATQHQQQQHDNKHAANEKLLFPMILFNLLNDAAAEGFEDIVSWNASGRSFKIHDRPRFLADVLPRYLRLKHYKSFVRQCNLWGFSCIHGGRKEPNRGSYQHAHFIRGRADLCEQVCRMRKKRQPKNKGVRRSPPKQIAPLKNANPAAPGPPPAKRPPAKTATAKTAAAKTKKTTAKPKPMKKNSLSQKHRTELLLQVAISYENDMQKQQAQRRNHNRYVPSFVEQAK
eukprot:CAMPEP_0119546496 /NCGR_PEP_ID=MMETSP1352-20130426/895_1 /TAXON_ID=265584 /ORGANISM="Stauroneis constricta, Strain CCMP1120" /LENGTH=254 /DNA_ID=CAMNT_0007591207 /DNA_START=220 /DNA_END=984 /DNA_ORIENTATION=-